MKKKRLLSLLLCLLLTVSPLLGSTAAAAESVPTSPLSMALSLKKLGLFRGVSDTEFDLDRAPTRAEALVMLLRLMGLEQEALATGGKHPFTDLTGLEWAEPYVGYAYANGITKGVSDHSFDGNGIADAKTYLTFVLRALGYRDGEGADFQWETAVYQAIRADILPASVNPSDFLRRDVVLVSYAALNAVRKGTTTTLAQALTEQGAVSAAALERYYDAKAAANGCFSDAVSANLYDDYAVLRLPLGIDISGKAVQNGYNIYQIGDAGYERYGFYAQGLSLCAAQIRNAAETLGDRARVFGIVVPNALGAVLSDSDYHLLSPTTRTETEAIAYSYDCMGTQVHTVDAIRALRLHNDEYIYFRTDHHWTALGAYYAYTAWAKEAGLTPKPLSSFSVRSYPGHLGLFFDYAADQSLMQRNPDTVYAYDPGGNITVETYDYSGNWGTGQLLYDYSNLGYKYGTFLNGDRPLTVITNNDVSDDSACVLVKDSYGNPFSVYLTQHYHTVYVVDYRYYADLPGYLTFSRFAEEKGVEDFIVLLPMTLSQSEVTARYLSNYCK